MSNEQKTPVSSAEPADAVSHNAARRKAILKGLGKTAAVAGAAIPLSSLAGARLRYESAGKNFHCSTSGHMSVLMSGAVTQIAVCQGLLPSEYKFFHNSSSTWNGTSIGKGKWARWPNNGTNAICVGVNGTAFTPIATFSQVFGAGPSDPNTDKIGFLVTGGTASGQWITALLNAQRYPSKFPHTPAEVIAQYTGDATRKAAALSLYENHVNKFTTVT